MTCLEARKCIYDYLNHNLEDERLRGFLAHLEECPDCMEELRITHMVYSGVAKLDNDDDNLNLDREFRRTLERSRMHLLRLTGLRIARYSMDTAVFWALLFMLIMQLRRWMIG